jgi:hypothetical protein
MRGRRKRCRCRLERDTWHSGRLWRRLWCGNGRLDRIRGRVRLDIRRCRFRSTGLAKEGRKSCRKKELSFRVREPSTRSVSPYPKAFLSTYCPELSLDQASTDMRPVAARKNRDSWTFYYTEERAPPFVWPLLLSFASSVSSSQWLSASVVVVAARKSLLLLPLPSSSWSILNVCVFSNSKLSSRGPLRLSFDKL